MGRCEGENLPRFCGGAARLPLRALSEKLHRGFVGFLERDEVRYRASTKAHTKVPSTRLPEASASAWRARDASSSSTGGTLTVDSVLGSGSTLQVTLPLGASA